MAHALMVDHQVAAPAMLATPMEPHSAQWHALRRTGIGGSDAAAALGVSEWRSPYELYLDKLGQLEQQPPTQAQLWGIRMESVILQAYSDFTGHRIVIPKATFRSERWSFMLANLDGFVEPDGQERRLVDAKNVGSAEGWGEPGSDDVPLPYLLQMQHYMIVTGMRAADLAVLVRGQDFRIYTIRADADLQTMIVDGEAKFWAMVQAQSPPDAKTPEDARKRWGSLHSKGKVYATEEQLAVVQELAGIHRQVEALTEQEDRLRTAVMSMLADKGDVLVDQHFGRDLVTWKRQEGAQRFDLDRFRVDHPDLAADYTHRASPLRRFLIKAGAYK